MAKDTQSRKWILTINNPIEKGFTHDEIRKTLSGLSSVSYWCMADEIGNKTGTFHTHIFLCGSGGIWFSTLKTRFPPADLKMAKGTALQCMEYVSKTGKWEHDKKSDTRVEGSFQEFGTMPVERQGSRNDLADLYIMVKSGMSNFQILEDMPDALTQIDRLDKIRQTVRQEQFADVFRQLEVSYIFGSTGTGKTRGIMEKYGYRNVYRITDYAHPFDGYEGQDVVVFEEFRSSLSIAEMLMYLDGYPLSLPCRYNNKQACYTKVFLVTNVPIHDQYPIRQRQEYDSWLAFLRRFGSVVQYKTDEVVVYDIEMIRDDWRLVEREHTPFDLV